MHSCAHTADVLKFLGRNPLLDADGQVAILEGIARKTTAPTGVVFTHGEDDRMAAAVLSILRRDDFEPEALDVFLEELARAGAAYRTMGADFSPEVHASDRNARNLVRSLHADLARGALRGNEGRAESVGRALLDCPREALREKDP